MSYLRYLCLFGSSLPPVVCRRAHVLFAYSCLFAYWCSTCLDYMSNMAGVKMCNL
jgi:hypothetical protein